MLIVRKMCQRLRGGLYGACLTQGLLRSGCGLCMGGWFIQALFHSIDQEEDRNFIWEN